MVQRECRFGTIRNSQSRCLYSRPQEDSVNEFAAECSTDSLASPGSSDKPRQATSKYLLACGLQGRQSWVSLLPRDKAKWRYLLFVCLNWLALNISFSPPHPLSLLLSPFLVDRFQICCRFWKVVQLRFEFCHCLLFIDIVEFCPNIKVRLLWLGPQGRIKFKKKNKNKNSLNSWDSWAIFIGYFLKLSCIGNW